MKKYLNHQQKNFHYLKLKEQCTPLSHQLAHALVIPLLTLGQIQLKLGLIDEIVAYIAPSILGSGSSFVGDLDISSLSERMDYQIHSFTQIGNDLRVTLIGRR